MAEISERVRIEIRSRFYNKENLDSPLNADTLTGWLRIFLRGKSVGRKKLFKAFYDQKTMIGAQVRSPVDLLARTLHLQNC